MQLPQAEGVLPGFPAGKQLLGRGEEAEGDGFPRWRALQSKSNLNLKNKDDSDNNNYRGRMMMMMMMMMFIIIWG